MGYRTTYSYDTYGNVTLEQDPLSHTTQYHYGLYDQLTQRRTKTATSSP